MTKKQAKDIIQALVMFNLKSNVKVARKMLNVSEDELVEALKLVTGRW